MLEPFSFVYCPAKHGSHWRVLSGAVSDEYVPKGQSMHTERPAEMQAVRGIEHVL